MMYAAVLRDIHAASVFTALREPSGSDDGAMK